LFEVKIQPPTKKTNIMELVFATHNLNKVIEVQDMLSSHMQLVGLDQLGFNEDIDEDGLDLASNAQIKAMHIYGVFGKNCFADDTGLEVDALNGLPGVYSARFAGEQKSDKDNIDLLLSKMKNKSNRKAQFRTVICLVLDGEQHLFEGIIEGEITMEPRGSGGFGYDSIFIPKGFDITFAEMDAYTKNAISHRYLAFKKIVKHLNALNTI
jgi:XTP/dITP diphosphohydrolase